MAVRQRKNHEEDKNNKKKQSNKVKAQSAAKYVVVEPRSYEMPNKLEYFTKLNKVTILCAFMCGIINSVHVSSMFENDRHFSHLSNLEREMTFRTEMGLYYSYYKEMVEAPSFVAGLNKLTRDNLTEYPDHINTLQRFNLFPELILGGTYRVFDSICSYFGLQMKVCWQVSRSGGLPPVVSCEGLGDPMYWYLAGVWFCSGLTASLIFLHGTTLSGTLLGGFISVTCFFFNHGEATRVQWTPPLRESFAFPLSILLNIIVTEVCRIQRPMWLHYFYVSCSVIFYMVFWQFSQYTIVIVLGIVYSMYTVGMIKAMPMLCVLFGTIYGFFQSVLIQFCNPLLLASPLAATLLGILLLYVFLEPLLSKLPAPTNTGVQLSFLFLSSVASKIEISRLMGIEDDAHITNILKAKLSNYSDFHTLLYTCSAEFDFLPKETLTKLNETLLLPCVSLICGAIFICCFNTMKQNFLKGMDDNREALTPIWTGIDPGVVFNIILLFAYGVMATLIMRLKLFFTPQLCVMASLLSARKYWKSIKSKEKHMCIVVLIMSCMCLKGIKNIIDQRSIVGEYMDPELESLLNWVETETPKDAAFAGPMPTMANLLLSTRRPIVNHPHYEYKPLRERTKKVYSIFSRRSAQMVYETLLAMKVDYIVLEEAWCLRKSKEGCGMVDLWDVEEPKNKNKPPLCPKLFHRSPAPFHRVFSNEQYVVLQVPSKYVEIPAPRVHSA